MLPEPLELKYFRYKVDANDRGYPNPAGATIRLRVRSRSVDHPDTGASALFEPVVVPSLNLGKRHSFLGAVIVDDLENF